MSSNGNKSRKSRKCPHCKGGPETFRYVKSVFKFDVDLARQLVQRPGHEQIELDPEDVKHSVDTTRIYPQHLEHVDVQYPGIIAHIWYPEPDGSILQGHTLIDGHHRAARCLQLGVPYFVQILSEAESKAVLIEGPDVEKIVAGVLATQA